MSDYLIRLHYNPTPMASNRLYTARYELGIYRVSIYERLWDDGAWRKYKAELELNGGKQSCGLVKQTQYVFGT
jgi:hypothetical protein